MLLDRCERLTGNEYRQSHEFASGPEVDGRL